MKIWEQYKQSSAVILHDRASTPTIIKTIMSYMDMEDILAVEIATTAESQTLRRIQAVHTKSQNN